MHLGASLLSCSSVGVLGSDPQSMPLPCCACVKYGTARWSCVCVCVCAIRCTLGFTIPSRRGTAIVRRADRQQQMSLMTPMNGTGSLLFKDTATKTAHSTPESRNGGVCGSCHARHAVHVRVLVFARPYSHWDGFVLKTSDRVICRAYTGVPGRARHPAMSRTDQDMSMRPMGSRGDSLDVTWPRPYRGLILSRLVLSSTARPWLWGAGVSGVSGALNSGLRRLATGLWTPRPGFRDEWAAFIQPAQCRSARTWATRLIPYL